MRGPQARACRFCRDARHDHRARRFITIYIDADACPVKQEVYRVAERHGLKVYVVSNSPIAVPRDPFIERVVVAAGMDAADDWIAERAAKGAIVVTPTSRSRRAP